MSTTPKPTLSRLAELVDFLLAGIEAECKGIASDERRAAAELLTAAQADVDAARREGAEQGAAAERRRSVGGASAHRPLAAARGDNIRGFRAPRPARQGGARRGREAGSRCRRAERRWDVTLRQRLKAAEREVASWPKWMRLALRHDSTELPRRKRSTP